MRWSTYWCLQLLLFHNQLSTLNFFTEINETFLVRPGVHLCPLVSWMELSWRLAALRLTLSFILKGYTLLCGFFKVKWSKWRRRRCQVQHSTYFELLKSDIWVEGVFSFFFLMQQQQILLCLKHGRWSELLSRVGPTSEGFFFSFFFFKDQTPLSSKAFFFVFKNLELERQLKIFVVTEQDIISPQEFRLRWFALRLVHSSSARLWCPRQVVRH